ncbi:Ppx/GppA phosphatase family protein [Sanguibacter antarcticus]|uniref:Exopolyphosphatase/guanosine-5'-triphosphate, 3'-diphosphate pyrophosphatase n=1 Tax=Sanguibacter antarcticus TaxID=372484 RepID=A0A2A9E7D1_9MICO|nr:Ppx/GppA phosphatase family protein [Sanguibacter antarcticus]PFG34967.1 exopolyphosphatase/guanosine-5'-triphosphate,3'-diphosphate pyrophosphatase [Sanguibacter antarcticus]
MRLGVIDIGSNTIHLAVVDAVRGARPVPAASQRTVVRLMRYLDDDGAISPEGVEALTDAVATAVEAARSHAVDEVLAIATSAVRDATNGPEVLAVLEQTIGSPLRVLSGESEARLTFLAVRRWYGWGAGRLLVLDIGGGSLEVAAGSDEEPEVAMSLPLGAGRLTRAHLRHDPPLATEMSTLREVVQHELESVRDAFADQPAPDHVVVTSKTFRSLARLAGAEVDAVGPADTWRMRRADLKGWVGRLAAIPAEQRESLPGITAERTHQIVAGALVAHQTMKALGVDEVEVCPWALREGVLLRRLDQL